MNKRQDPNYKAKICNSIGLIEGAIEYLTETEMKAVLCAAITKVLVDRDYCPLEAKQFFVEFAAGAIEGADATFKVYKR